MKDLPSTEDASPPPAVVFCRQLEVGQGHGDTGGDTQQDAVDHEQDAIQRVLLSSPQCRKDVVQLNRDGTEETMVLYPLY